MDYVPPQQLYVAYQDVVKRTDDLCLLGSPCARTVVTKEDCTQCALHIKGLLTDGLQWSDFGPMMQIALHYLDDSFYLSSEEKRKAIVQILNTVIDITDTPYLPDQFSDPVFKAMVPSFVYLVVPDYSEKLSSLSGTLTEGGVRQYVSEVAGRFQDGLQWSDIASILRDSIHFINRFTDLSFEERKTLAKNLIDHIIDATDTPSLPDYFFDPIFKQFAHPLIDIAFGALWSATPDEPR
jgi:hypothetical protein